MNSWTLILFSIILAVLAGCSNSAVESANLELAPTPSATSIPISPTVTEIVLPTSTPPPNSIIFPDDGVFLGIAVENNDPTVSSVSRWEDRLGKEFGAVALWYGPCQIQNKQTVCTDYFTQNMMPFALDGKAIVLVWGPGGWNADTQEDDPNLLSYHRILEGKYDQELMKFAEILNAFPAPIIIRFGHEMNIPENPNSALNLFGEEGNLPWNRVDNQFTYYGDPDVRDGPERYCDTYSYVRGIFDDAGVNNVYWAFSPNYVSSESLSWNNLDAYWCMGWDLMAPSVYPYANLWYSFDDQYNHIIRPFWENHQVPVILGEWSAPEDERKPEYYQQTLDSISNFPEIKGIVIFAGQYEQDWRPNSSATALNAIQEALSSQYFINGIELEYK